MQYIYGHHCVQEAIKNTSRKIQGVACLQQHHEMYKKIIEQSGRCIPLKVCGKYDLDFIRDHVHQGVIAYVHVESAHKIADCKKILLLDQVQDLRNLGAIIRSAAAFGVDQVIYVKSHTMNIFEQRNYALLAKAASGALEHVNLMVVSNLARCMEECKERGFWVIGLDERGQDLRKFDVPEKYVLLVGAEGNGLRELTKKKCDFLCKIDTNPQFPCLNASVAASIALALLDV